MSTLDRITDMQRQGLSETEISRRLQNEGLSPQEINNSLNQLKIKGAFSTPREIQNQEDLNQQMQSSISQSQMPPLKSARSMIKEIPLDQSSIKQAQQWPRYEDTQYPQREPMEGNFSPPPLYPEVYPPEQPQIGGDYYQPEQKQDYYPQENPQAYSNQEYYPQGSGTDTEMISEIAEQVVQEKLDEFKKKTGDIALFKITIQETVADIDDRLKRIESSIDTLQRSIIGKIGEFGESTALIHRDLENVHGTMSKLVDPLMDNYNELKKLAESN